MTEEQAKEYFNNHGCCCPFGSSPFNCEDKDCRFGQAIRAIFKEQPQGEWIELGRKTKNGITPIAVRCTKCGNSPKYAIKSKFCPNCGAKMKL